jgi:hypothetical protein
MDDSKEIPKFPTGSRVVLTGSHLPKNSQFCTIVRVLQNPSGRPENQWYDVKFDDNTVGRFVARYLAHVNSTHPERQAKFPAA